MKLKLNNYTKLKIIIFEDFMKKYNLQNDTMNKLELQKVYT